eukprot:gene38216-46437_t
MDFTEKDRKSSFSNVNGLDMNKFAPLYQLPQQKRSTGPEYITSHNRGRDIMGRLSFNTGVLWLGGFVGGGAYGFVEGWRTAVNPTYKVRFNNVLNAVSKRGSSLGSSLGVIAFMHTCGVGIADALEIEHQTGQPYATPLFAGMLTGGLYKSMRGPRAAVLASVLGGAASCAYWYGSTYVYDVLLRKGGKF